MVPDCQVEQDVLYLLVALLLLNGPHQREECNYRLILVTQAHSRDECRHRFRLLRDLIEQVVIPALLLLVADVFEEAEKWMMEKLLRLRSIMLVSEHQAQELLHRNVLNSESDDLDSLRIVDLSEFLQFFQAICLGLSLQLGTDHEFKENDSD